MYVSLHMFRFPDKTATFVSLFSCSFPLLLLLNDGSALGDKLASITPSLVLICLSFLFISLFLRCLVSFPSLSLPYFLVPLLYYYLQHNHTSFWLSVLSSWFISPSPCLQFLFPSLSFLQFDSVSKKGCNLYQHPRRSTQYTHRPLVK